MYCEVSCLRISLVPPGWRQSIQDVSRDHTDARQARYTLGLDIVDAEGNRFVGEMRLPVE